MGGSRAAHSLGLLLLTTFQLLARVIALSSALSLGLWLVFLGTRKYTQDEPWRVFPPDYGCDERLLLDACAARELAYMWLLPLLLAAASLALLWLRARLDGARGGAGAGAAHHEAPRRSGALARLGGALLPPRRFWLWWCGGLSVSDGLAVAFWAAFNASWAVAVLSRFFSLIPFFSKVSPNPHGLEFQLVAVAMGVLLLPNFVLLFYPVTRGSVVLQAAGLSYPDAIRYHRWLGHAVMVLATGHSLGFWGIWLVQGKFLQEALDQGAVFNNLAGGVSFLGGLALWLSSLEVARRTNYEVFYKLHHIGFWIFTFAGCCHYWEMFWYFLPGLVLYGVDGVYRIHQGLGFWGAKTGTGPDGVQVLQAVASPGGTTCSLLLAAPKFGIAASGFVWINVPAIGWHSWHPFEYFAVPAAGGGSNGGGGSGGQTAMLLHIKAYDRWTRALVDLVAARGVNFAVKIEGPYAELPGAVLGHPELSGVSCGGPASSAAAAAAVGGGKDAAVGGGGGGAQHSAAAGGHGEADGLVIAAGGVGATAAMSVFQELGTSGEAAAARGLPTLLIWCCRKADELEFLAPRLFAMAETLGLNLTIKLFCTGDPAATSGAALAAGSGAAAKPAAAVPAPIAVSTGGAAAPPAGLTTTSMCPVVALKKFNCQAGHKALLHALAFAGTLGAILGVRYFAEVRPALAGLEPWTTGQKGASLVLSISAAILLPGSLALWAALAAQRWQQRRGGGCAAAAAGAAATGGSAAGAAAAPRPARPSKELSRHLLSDDESTPNGTPTAAAAAAAAAASPLSACATSSAGLGASAVAAAAIAAGGFATVRPAASGGSWELVLPEPVAADAASDTAPRPDTANPRAFALEPGRPPLQALVAAWLASLKQLPHGAAAGGQEDGAGAAGGCLQGRAGLLQVDVYGMGPSKLVEDAKLLCDEVNAAQRRPGAAGPGPRAWLRFVQKTHEL